MLFKPNLDGIEKEGIHELIYSSIMKCDTDMRNDVFNNIVCAGGTSMFQGIAERMQKEIKKKAPQSTIVKIIAPPERQLNVICLLCLGAGIHLFLCCNLEK